MASAPPSAGCPGVRCDALGSKFSLVLDRFSRRRSSGRPDTVHQPDINIKEESSEEEQDEVVVVLVLVEKIEPLHATLPPPVPPLHALPLASRILSPFPCPFSFSVHPLPPACLSFTPLPALPLASASPASLPLPRVAAQRVRRDARRGGCQNEGRDAKQEMLE
ncbi:hypothetical protein O3P69_000702 [Scylla paramamosain]|uniref:Uncharacterized protein n=1 Tax=Scylla paramamosain TaxID=85552 RepID=A0AAW0UQP5_SCYPA